MVEGGVGDGNWIQGDLVWTASQVAWIQIVKHTWGYLNKFISLNQKTLGPDFVRFSGARPFFFVFKNKDKEAERGCITYLYLGQRNYAWTPVLMQIK